MAGDLKLESFSDREILHILNDLAGSGGWVEVEHVATRVGLTVDGMSDAQLALHSKRCVTVRLAWIKRLSGCVERNPDYPLSWRLTEAGRQVVNVRLSKTVEHAMDEMSEYATLAALGNLGRRYQRAEMGPANLMRREFTHGIHPKRRA